MKKKDADQMPKRWQWLIQMIRDNNFTIGAEIGCHTGATTKRLLGRCPNLILYAVDHWEPILNDPTEAADEKGGMEGRDGKRARRKFEHDTYLFKGRRKVLVGNSLDMAKLVDDNSLDFVFIDADHRYTAVLSDIKAWAPKVKQGGIVCGHDYDFKDYPGVRKAVTECFGEKHNEAGIDRVWYAKKEDYIK